jgi:hypothetical protein
MRTTTKLLVLVLTSAFLGACASRGELEQISPGRVAVVAAHYAPHADFNAYARGMGANVLNQGGKSAAKGVGYGAVGPAYLASGLGQIHPVLGMLALPLVVAGGAVGGVIGGAVGLIDGAANAMPSDYVTAIHQPIEHARRDGAIQEALAQRVLGLAADLPQHRLTYLPELGPKTARDMPDYQALKAGGFEYVLELGVTSIGFEAVQGDPPTAFFEMALRARAVPLTTDAKPWLREQTYRGTPRTLLEWQADKGPLFQQELDASYRSLAQFASAMFGSAPVVAPALEPVAPAAPPIISDTTKSEQAPASISPAGVVGSSLPAAGDTWTYQLTGPKRRHRQSQTHQVTVLSVTGDTIIEQLAGASPTAQTGHPKGRYLAKQGAVSLFSPYFAAFDSLEPSAHIARIENLDPDFCSPRWVCSISARVVGKEIVRVPAGEFEVIRVEVEQAWSARSQGLDNGARTLTIWYSPQTKRAVKFSSRGSYSLYIESDFDLELASYRVSSYL